MRGQIWNRFNVIASALLIVLVSLGQTVSAEAYDRDATSDLLLPYFAIDLAETPERTTFFTITNTSAQQTPTVLKVHSNWGIEVVKTIVTFGKFEQKAFDLYEWLALGRLPDRQLNKTELAEVQDKLTGKKVDGRLYASATKEGQAVGYLTFEAAGRERVFCGNYYLLEPGKKLEDGEILIHFDHLGLCNRHSVFLLKNGVYDSSSRVVLWLKKKGHTSAQPIKLSKLIVFGYDTHGTRHRLTETPIALISTQMIPLSELGWQEGILWLELESEDGTVVVVHYLDSESGRSAALRTCCFNGGNGECVDERPAIAIEKSTNGQDADSPPGPRLAPGDTVTWKYVVTNTGSVKLSNVKVSDDQLGLVSCPKTELQPGESMTCVEKGTAKVGQYKNVAMATGSSPCGRKVKDTDPSHYYGWDPCVDERPAINIEKSTNNVDADNPPGPELDQGDNVTWRYEVRNTGNVMLTNVTVADDQLGPITCPKTELQPGKRLSCRQRGTAKSGQYKNVATASGTSACTTVEDTDPSHYHGLPAGRMTGGNSQVEGADLRFTHGFTLRCNGQSRGINLEINWEGSKFKLKELSSVTCSDDPAIEPDPPAAPFDTIEGAGTGKLTIRAERGAPQRLDNASITFKLTDAGEPRGGRDWAEYTISHSSLDLPIVVKGHLVAGNHQAHAR